MIMPNLKQDVFIDYASNQRVFFKQMWLLNYLLSAGIHLCFDNIIDWTIGEKFMGCSGKESISSHISHLVFSEELVSCYSNIIHLVFLREKQI